jgi:hypothetical protein
LRDYLDPTPSARGAPTVARTHHKRASGRASASFNSEHSALFDNRQSGCQGSSPSSRGTLSSSSVRAPMGWP